MKIDWIGAHSNNYTVGRNGKTPNKVVVHWIVGKLSAADATFNNPDRQATAHYGVEGTTIHQYVKESDTAWHASNWDVNLTSIGIEHSGGELQADGTRRKPSDATHETSGKLVADICRRYNIPIDRDHILPHNKYSATQCPGTLDLDRIINIARDQATPDPQPERIDLGEPWGEMEVQAIISTLNDQKRDLENCQNNCEQRLEQAVELAKLETSSDYQTKLESANAEIDKLHQTISTMETKALEDYHWRVLMSQAWKNWWKERKGGENT